MAHSATACGKCLAISVRDTDTVQEVKQRYAQHTGASLKELRITFCEEELENHVPLFRYGIASGDIKLVSLGREGPIIQPGVESEEELIPHAATVMGGRSFPVPRILAATTMEAASTNSNGNVDAITVTSKQKPVYPDLTFRTIRLSCESHIYSHSELNYAGFLLYAWTDEYGKVQQDWWLNGKHCKSAYLVVQGSDSNDVKRYIGKAPGQVHGAVYWNVYGEKADVTKAVGEGFSFQNGVYKWNSYTFNANSDAYHDGRRQISKLGKKCVERILDDWRMNSRIGKTYKVEELLQ